MRIIDWFKTLKTTLKLTFTIIPLALVIYFIGFFFEPLRDCIIAKVTTKAQIKIVDVSINESEGCPTILDLKLRNNGEKVAYIKKVNFDVKKIFIMRMRVPSSYVYIFPYFKHVSPYFKHVPPSYRYNVELPSRGAPYKKEKEITQGIKPNDIDRLEIALDYTKDTTMHWSDLPSSYNLYIFNMKVSLIYNETDDIVRSKNLIFLISPPNQNIRGIGVDPESEAYFEHNREILREIRQIKGEKSLWVKGFIRRFLGQ